MVSRKGRLAQNASVSIMYQIVLIISGFVLPRYILNYYGSNTNGLLSSVTQFLSIVSFCELGFGAVVQSALFKPLHDKNEIEISKIFKSASRFFKIMSLIIVIYVIALAFIYPVYVSDKFDIMFTAGLILVMSCSYITQYLFGIVRQLLLDADQKVFVEIIPQIIATIVATILSVILIKSGSSLLVVKGVTAVVYTVRPIYLFFYVKKHYNIDYNIQYSEEPIKQKWNGIAQHITNIIFKNTDIILLNIFANLSVVSIYSVYSMIIKAFNSAIESISISITSFFGSLLADNDVDKINKSFSVYEFASHFLMTVLFALIIVLINPFIKIYTMGVDDADYYAPLFSLLLSLAYFFSSVRTPYHIVIKAAGHFKETQESALLEALINIVVSIVMSKLCSPLVGVTIGTIVAMIYRLVYYVDYLAKRILYRKRRVFYGHLLVNGIVIVFSIGISYAMPECQLSYLSWVIRACLYAIIIIAFASFINCIIYRKEAKSAVRVLKSKFRNK